MTKTATKPALVEVVAAVPVQHDDATGRKVYAAGEPIPVTAEMAKLMRAAGVAKPDTAKASD